MKYPNLEKHLKDKGLKAKEKIKITKDFQTLSAKEKYEILEQIARDLGYIE